MISFVLDRVYAIADTTGVVTVARSATFDQWVKGLRDRRAVARINMRLQRVENTGNLGDASSVGNVVSELRINYGPGYRLYFMRERQSVIVLLCGGDKDSQQRDITRAKRIADEWREANA